MAFMCCIYNLDETNVRGWCRLANGRDDLVGEGRYGGRRLSGFQFAEDMALVVGGRAGTAGDEGENGSVRKVKGDRFGKVFFLLM